MDNFTTEMFNVKNKNEFSTMLFTLNLDKLKTSVFEFLLRRKSEEEFYDLESFTNHNGCGGGMKTMIEVVSHDLKELGWNLQIAFGGTGLYIYSTPEPPSTCW